MLMKNLTTRTTRISMKRHLFFVLIPVVRVVKIFPSLIS